MTVAVFASGTQAAVVTTEHFLSNVNIAGKFTGIIDLSNMAAGDVVELRAYQMVLTAGTARVIDFIQLAGAQPTDAMIVEIGRGLKNELTDANSLRYSLKQTFGTGRNFAWKVINEDLYPANFTALSIDGSGVAKANLAQILGTALTETAGQIAAAFKKLFDVAAPVLTATSVNQTGDNYARLGTPAGASVSADVAAIKSDSGAVKIQTDKLAFTVANQVDANVLDWKSATAPAMTGDAFARLGAPAGVSVSADIAQVEANVLIGISYVDTEVAAIKAKTDNLPAVPAAVGSAMTLAAGQVVIKKNTGLNNFAFLMRDSTDHVTPKTGLAVTPTRSINGAAFGACANAVSEISNGVYAINLAAADLNGDVIVLKFSATGADQRTVTILTQA